MWLLKYHLSVFLIFFVSLNSFSQALNRNTNPNHIEIGLYNGVALNRFIPHTGFDKLENPPGLNHNLLFTYDRLLTNQISLSAGWGFGFQAFNYDIEAKDGFVGTKREFYWQKAQYNIFHKLEIKGNYYLQINRLDRLKFGIGGGFVQFLSSGFGISSFNAESVNEYVINVDYPAQITPLALVSIDYVKQLKNKNEIELGLSYTKGFKNVYEGEYSLYSESSTGQIVSDGSNIGVKLSYVFTGNKKRQELNSRIDAGENSKVAKIELRKERRYLDPKSTFVNIYFGNGITVNKVDDAGGYIGNARCNGVIGGFEYEHGLKKNLYLTGGYHFMEYYDATRIVYSSFSVGYNAFFGHEFNFGGGYRWITPANLKIVNIYAGVFSGFTTTDKGETSTHQETRTIYFNQGIDPVLEITINGTDKIESKLISGVYFGVSKDFHIIDMFWISLNYRYQQGFNTVQKTDMTYTTNQFEGFREATNIIDGTAHLLSLGLKLRFR